MFAACLFLCLTQAPTSIERVEIVSREPVTTGGTYERMQGTLHFAFDPEAPDLDVIVDLDLAPRDADGKVRCRANFEVLQPVDPALRSGTGLLEVSNRGGKATVNFFGMDWVAAQGMTLIWVGWQADVPPGGGRMRLDAPVARASDGSALTGLVRCDWMVDEPLTALELGHRGMIPYSILAPESAAHRLTARTGRMGQREDLPRASWSFTADGRSIRLEGGFPAGRIYELVYTASDPLVVGLGLAVVRDTILYAKSDESCPFRVERGVGFGISQTGRFLRHFLWQGFNATPGGGKAFDGLLIHTAGAGRGSFNHRFAQPSRDAHRSSAFFYPTDLFPFSGAVQKDAVTGLSDGIYARALADGTMPKVFLTNSGYEYWGRSAALTHVAIDGSADLKPLPQERWYHLRGAQHYPSPWSQRGSANPLDVIAVERAMLRNLLDWVEKGVEPPPSHVPRLQDGSLVPVADYAWPPELGPPPRAAQEAYRCDYGPRWRVGIIDVEPPKLGKPFPVLVPQADARGNEIGGAPNLETMVPLGAFVPWRLRPDGELADFVGQFLPYSAATLAALYPGGREDFLRRAEAAVDQLIRERFLLTVDRARALARAAEAWDTLAKEQSAQESSTWPQGAGPHGDWSAEGPPPPLRFSARTGENLIWRTPMPETGQGGIAVHGERIYVTTMAPWDPAHALNAEDAERFRHATEGRSVVGKDVDAHCLDSRTGTILWSRRIRGEVPSIYSYPFSDATSASPVTDGERVWFTNAGGAVVCFTHEGEQVWERRYLPAFDGPFNKQFEPFLVQDGARKVFIHMEPFPAPGADDPADPHGRWHHIVGLDALTGKLLWRSAEALTQYNAPTLVPTPAGPCILHARGGPHEVPERPVGMSLTILTGPRAGQSLWRYEDPRGNHEAALQTMAHDADFAYWILKEPHGALVVIDLKTGKELREISLTRGVTLTARDPASGAWSTSPGVNLELGVFPARYSMIAAGGKLHFQCYATAWGQPTIGPPYSFGRVDPQSGLVEYLEVPTDVVHETGKPDAFLWRNPRSARALNSRGVEVTGDERSRWGGWDWVFNGSPTRVNERLYYTLASGLVYVLDASAPVFDQRAFLALNDLGTAGAIWTANSVSYAAGRLYHRTAAEILCFGAPR
jgi:hypothetical protein